MMRPWSLAGCTRAPTADPGIHAEVFRLRCPKAPDAAARRAGMTISLYASHRKVRIRHAIRSNDDAQLFRCAALRPCRRWQRRCGRSNCASAGTAILQAEVLSKTAGIVGAVAFSRTGDPDIGIFDDAVVLKRFGEVPTDLTIWS